MSAMEGTPSFQSAPPAWPDGVCKTKTVGRNALFCSRPFGSPPGCAKFALTPAGIHKFLRIPRIWRPDEPVSSDRGWSARGSGRRAFVRLVLLRLEHVD